MCGSSPKPDPQIGQAALRQAAIAEQSFALGKEQFEFEKAEWAKYAPYYERMFKTAAADAEKQSERSDMLWDDWVTQYRPIEQKYAQEVLSYGSPEESARREGLAAATVQGQIDAQRGDTTRELARMGVSAARAGQQLTSDTTNLALAKAGAVNTERNNTALTGIALRGQAAQTGRGIPALGLSYAGEGRASTGQAVGVNASGQGFRAGGMSMFTGPAQLAVGANNSAAQILNQQYQNQVEAAKSKYGALGTIAGAGLSFLTGGTKPWILT
jgi:hypothetical protein